MRKPEQRRILGASSKRSVASARPGRWPAGGRISAGCVLALAVATVLWPASSSVAAESGKPAIKAEEANHDFGTFWVGTELKHSFKIGNTGTAPLKITAVKRACGCTAPGKYPESIPPGKFQRAITIESNDPDTPRLKLTLVGMARQYVEVAPRSARFDTTYADGPKKRVLQITNNAESPAEIKLAPSTKDGKFNFQLVEKKAGYQYELHVSTTPPYKQTGTVRTTVVLQTGLEAQKTIKVNALARVAGRLDVRPSRILLSKPQSNGKKASVRQRLGTVTFRNNGPSPVKLLEATVDDPLILVTTAQKTAGRLYQVRLQMPHDYLPPKEGCTLTLTTDDPERPTLKVPIQRRQSKKSPRPARAMVGRPVPAFEIASASGGLLSDRALQDAVSVLNFFAVNRPFCQKQLPKVQSLRPIYEAKGVRFVNVCRTMRGKRFSDEQVRGKLREMGVDAELATDPDNKIGKLFRVTSYPTMFLVGKSGKIEAVNIGNAANLDARLTTQLDRLLSGKPLTKVVATKRKVATDGSG